jgi:hypothetical protein
MPEMTDSQIAIVMTDLRNSVRLARGWYKKISADTGCSKTTLSRIAHEPDYDPRLSEVIKIERWLRENGIPLKGLQGKETSGKRRQLDQFPREAFSMAPDAA